MSKIRGKVKVYVFAGLLLMILALLIAIRVVANNENQDLANFHARPFISSISTKLKVKSSAAVSSGMSPETIKSIYNLPTGKVGSGTIAIIDAYDNPNIEPDLATFDGQYNLPSCTAQKRLFYQGENEIKNNRRHRLGTRGSARCGVGTRYCPGC